MSAAPHSLRAIADIKIGERFQRDLGDIESLARSIDDVSLLHPIVIQPDGTLIAGRRRLAACSTLGWEHVPVRVMDLEAVVRGEHDENAHRKDFQPTEIDAIRRALEPIERAAAREPQGARTDQHPGKFAHRFGGSNPR
jgi:ParB-like chromosome segregation protein Spo0J